MSKPETKQPWAMNISATIAKAIVSGLSQSHNLPPYDELTMQELIEHCAGGIVEASRKDPAVKELVEAADKLSSDVMEADSIEWDNPACHSTVTDDAIKVSYALEPFKVASVVVINSDHDDAMQAAADGYNRERGG